MPTIIIYSKPTNLCGSILFTELQSAGLPINSDSDISVSGSSLKVVYSRDLTSEENTQATSIVNSHNATQSAINNLLRDMTKTMALSLSTSISDPNIVASRNAHRVAYQSIIVLWNKINAIIDYLNSVGPIPNKLPSPKPWSQVVVATKQAISNETNPES